MNDFVIGLIMVIAFFGILLIFPYGRAVLSYLLMFGGLGITILAFEDQENLIGMAVGIVSMVFGYYLSQNLENDKDPWS